MADGVWKVVYPQVFGRSRQLSLNKFLDPSIPSMRKVDDGEKRKKREKNGENSSPLTSLPVDRLNGDRLQRRRSCQFFQSSSIFIMNCGILTNRKWNYGHVSVLPLIFVICSLTLVEVGHAFLLIIFIVFYFIYVLCLIQSNFI